jgi:hypothetical protein
MSTWSFLGPLIWLKQNDFIGVFDWITTCRWLYTGFVKRTAEFNTKAEALAFVQSLKSNPKIWAVAGSLIAGSTRWKVEWREGR